MAGNNRGKDMVRLRFVDLCLHKAGSVERWRSRVLNTLCWSRHVTEDPELSMAVVAVMAEYSKALKPDSVYAHHGALRWFVTNVKRIVSSTGGLQSTCGDYKGKLDALVANGTVKGSQLSRDGLERVLSDWTTLVQCDSKTAAENFEAIILAQLGESEEWLDYEQCALWYELTRSRDRFAMLTPEARSRLFTKSMVVSTMVTTWIIREPVLLATSDALVPMNGSTAQALLDRLAWLVQEYRDRRIMRAWMRVASAVVPHIMCTTKGTSSPLQHMLSVHSGSVDYWISQAALHIEEFERALEHECTSCNKMETWWRVEKTKSWMLLLHSLQTSERQRSKACGLGKSIEVVVEAACSDEVI
ncbi:hypothetical protein EV182_001435 [Spiromyces aspiralis]|uniref:Uncharacterized protein n=1 Tax=Spiromyces aspiralis TaxID=68401 RepID=A0ACC1HJ58_9FUNG|nr:hypothetical protein EV182_001435 [Spiromyces aspiralis]